MIDNIFYTIQFPDDTLLNKDGSGNNIVGTYATKSYADAYNITFSVSDEELTIKKNGTKPFSAWW